MQDYNDLLQKYEQLAAEAHLAFERAQQEYGENIKCHVQCSDCCHAIFGLFPIEAIYLNKHFKQLDPKDRAAILAAAEKADQELAELQQQLEKLGDDPQKINAAISAARIRCPLLSGDRKCLLYDQRPITCRVYGMPTVMNNKIHACWKAGFEKGKPYPTYDLDGVYKELHDLSVQILERAGEKDKDQASLLYSVARSLTGFAPSSG